MSSPVRAASTFLSRSPNNSPDESAHPRNTGRFAAARFEMQQLEKPNGYSGALAKQLMAKDAVAARNSNLPLELWGKEIGNKYYRRKAQHRGTRLKPGTYPPQTDNERTDPFLSRSAQGTGAGELPTRDDVGTAQLVGGRRRYTLHGGVLPLSPPGIIVPCRVGGRETRHAVVYGPRLSSGLYPLVNFGPRELLRINFRRCVDPEAQWAEVLNNFGAVKLAKPRAAKMLGDCVTDCGGSHETVNFQHSLGDARHTIGRQEFGSLHKDDLEPTANAKKRRVEGGHREVSGTTLKPGAMDLFKCILFSMAAVDVEFFYPMVVLLVGALTLWHCDSCYGGTWNAARLERAGGVIEIDYRVPYRQCVLKWGERYLVPLTLGNRNGETMRVLELLPDGSGQYTSEFCREDVYSMEVVGYLPFLVFACNKNNTVTRGTGTGRVSEIVATHKLISVIPDYVPSEPERTLLYEPAEASYMSSRDVIAAATACPERPHTMPPAEIRSYGHADKWILFRGWQFPHRYLGDPLIKRVHVFSRAMRQVPTAYSIHD